MHKFCIGIDVMFMEQYLRGQTQTIDAAVVCYVCCKGMEGSNPPTPEKS